MEVVDTNNTSQEGAPQDASRKLITHTATWGLYLGVALSLVTIVQMVAHLPGKVWWLQAIVWLSLLTFSYYAMKNYRLTTQGTPLSYGKALKVGFLTCLFATIILLAVTLIMLYAITPDYITTLKEELLVEMQAKLQDPDKVEMAYNMSSKFMTPGFIAVSSFLTTLFNGLIVSLIGAIFARSPRA